MNRIDTGRDSLTETVETTGKFDFITGSIVKKYPAGTLVHFEKEVPSDPESKWEIICTDAKESFRSLEIFHPWVLLKHFLYMDKI